MNVIQELLKGTEHYSDFFAWNS